MTAYRRARLLTTHIDKSVGWVERSDTHRHPSWVSLRSTQATMVFSLQRIAAHDRLPA